MTVAKPSVTRPAKIRATVQIRMEAPQTSAGAQSQRDHQWIRLHDTLLAHGSKQAANRSRP